MLLWEKLKRSNSPTSVTWCLNDNGIADLRPAHTRKLHCNLKSFLRESKDSKLFCWNWSWLTETRPLSKNCLYIYLDLWKHSTRNWHILRLSMLNDGGEGRRWYASAENKTSIRAHRKKAKSKNSIEGFSLELDMTLTWNIWWLLIPRADKQVWHEIINGAYLFTQAVCFTSRPVGSVGWVPD